MIARLRAAQNDFDGALKALLDGLKSNPDNSVLTQMLRDVRRSGARK